MVLTLLVVALGAAIASHLAWGGAGRPATVRERIAGALGLGSGRAERLTGLFALGTSTAVIVILMLFLTGPAEGHTYRGQVYFAVAVASVAGTYAARKITKARDAIWYWPAPLLAGLLGTLAAISKPDLLIPAAYRQLNSIPASGLVRVLPIEMMGVGLVATLWMLRSFFSCDSCA